MSPDTCHRTGRSGARWPPVGDRWLATHFKWRSLINWAGYRGVKILLTVVTNLKIEILTLNSYWFKLCRTSDSLPPEDTFIGGCFVTSGALKSSSYIPLILGENSTFKWFPSSVFSVTLETAFHPFRLDGALCGTNDSFEPIRTYQYIHGT